MALFIVAYRIHYNTEERYSRCYNELTDAIRAEGGPKHWAEPTSMFLIQSSKSSADLATSIWAAAPSFDDDEDMLVVINISTTRGHATKGKLQDRDFVTLMALRTS
ncbi:hypothetical protein [Brevundimonas bacteroides]|uniref:hypothetical protein n=1 Tax=Brevundimonas bacteroides TaxID=74311 RepID=UPI0004950AEA|nr:hypothetical protein [Brevundimonas bacteroides]